MGITILQDNAYEFHPDIKIPEQLRRLTKGPAYTCLLHILKEKLKSINGGEVSARDKSFFLKGRTGSGKSTYFPCKLFLDLKSTVWVLEPTVVLAQSIPTDTTKYFKELNLGRNIGYLTGQGRLKPTENRHIMYMTTEIFRQILIGGASLPPVIIFDEVHKMDKALLFCLQALKKRYNDLNNTLFIYQSATIDIPLMLNYIIGKEIYEHDLVGYIKGAQNYPCEEIWVGDDLLNKFTKNPETIVPYIMEYLVPKCIECKNTIIHNGLPIPARDMMMFVCGKKSMLIFKRAFENYRSKLPIHVLDLDESSFKKVPEWRQINKNKTRLLIIPYVQSINTFGKQLLQYNVDPDHESQLNEIKLYITTPVLEAGKTIDTLHLVIDGGLRHEVYFIPLIYKDERNQDLIFRVPADKSSIEQRVGRVGRKSSGVIIRLYSKKTYDMIPERNVPDNINNVSFGDIVIESLNSRALEFVDLMEGNSMIIPNSVDTILRTQQDLISAGLTTTFGANIMEDKETTSPILLQTKALQLIQGTSLEYAYFYSRLHRNDFTKLVTPIVDLTKQNHNGGFKDVMDAIVDTRKYFLEEVPFWETSIPTLDY